MKVGVHPNRAISQLPVVGEGWRRGLNEPDEVSVGWFGGQVLVE